MRLIDKTTIPRMPWHDMSMCVVSRYTNIDRKRLLSHIQIGAPVLDIARHFCERWNFIKHEKARHDENIPYLQPPLGGMGSQQRYIEEKTEEPYRYRKYRHNHRTRGVTGTMRVQVLRSSAKWSSGIELEVSRKIQITSADISCAQHSIQNAYIATILGAEHYIYIENQFFSNVTLN